MANTKVTGDLIASSTIATGNIADNAVTSDKISGITTAHITEGSNLYYTDARADARAALLVDSAPSTLNTLNELAAALGDDPNFATTTANSIGLKAPLASPTFTGTVTAPNFVLTGTDGFNLPSGGFLDWANGDARIVEGLVNNYSLSFQTYDGSAVSTALRLDGNNNATFSGNITFGDSHFIGDDGNDNLLIQSSAGENIIINSVDDLLLRTGGTTKLIVKNGGNVGIGTDSPSWQLEVENTGTVRTAVSSTTNGSSGLYFRVFNSGTQVGNGTIATQNNGDMKFFTGTSGEAERMRIASDGTITATNSANNLVLGNAAVGDMYIGGGNSNTQNIIFQAGSERMRITSSGQVNMTKGSSGTVLYLDGVNAYDAETGIQLSAGRAKISGFLNTTGGTPGSSLRFYTMPDNGSVTERLRIDSSGNVQLQTVGAQLRFQNSAGAAPYIKNSGEDASTAPYGQNLEFYTGGSKRLTIDSAGNVGIGTTSPTARLDVSQASGATLIRLSNSDATLVDAGDIQARLLFAGRYYSGSGTQNVTSEIRQIKNNGDGYGGGAEMAFLTNDTERMRILSSGGITFNGDTAAANALDDYEEGTWTPTVKGDITAGTATYGARGGSYTKIGNKVTCWFSILNFSQSGGVGAFTVAGLPFTCITTSAVRGCFGGNLRFYNMDFPDGYDVPSTNLDDNAAQFYILWSRDNSTWINQPVKNGGNQYIEGYVTYTTT